MMCCCNVSMCHRLLKTRGLNTSFPPSNLASKPYLFSFFFFCIVIIWIQNSQQRLGSEKWNENHTGNPFFMLIFSFLNSENVNLSVACPGVSCSPTSAAFPSEGWGWLTHLPNTTIKHLHLAITHQEVKRCLLPWRCGSCSDLASTDTCHCQACTPACCSGLFMT